MRFQLGRAGRRGTRGDLHLFGAQNGQKVAIRMTGQVRSHHRAGQRNLRALDRCRQERRLTDETCDRPAAGAVADVMRRAKRRDLARAVPCAGSRRQEPYRKPTRSSRTSLGSMPSALTMP